MLLSAANLPVELKLGFCFSGAGASPGCATSVKASDCEGSGPLRCNARGGELRDGRGERERDRGRLLDDRSSSPWVSRCRWLRCLCLRRSSAAELVDRSLRSRRGLRECLRLRRSPAELVDRSLR